eukprot:1160426-Pelagomonas_calceolata.AAC.6
MLRLLSLSGELPHEEKQQQESKELVVVHVKQQVQLFTQRHMCTSRAACTCLRGMKAGLQM